MPNQRVSAYRCRTVEECSEIFTRLEDFGGKGHERIRISRRARSRHYVPSLSKRPCGLVRKIEKLGFKSRDLRYERVSSAVDAFMRVNREKILDSICCVENEVLNFGRLSTLGALNDHFGKDCENLESLLEAAKERIHSSVLKADEDIENREQIDEKRKARREEFKHLLHSQKEELAQEYVEFQLQHDQKLEEIKEDHQTELENLEKSIGEKKNELDRLKSEQDEDFRNFDQKLQNDLEQLPQRHKEEIAALDQDILRERAKYEKKANEIQTWQLKILKSQLKSSLDNKERQKVLNKVQENRVVLYAPPIPNEVSHKLIKDTESADVSIFCMEETVPILCHSMILQNISNWFLNQCRFASKDNTQIDGRLVVKFSDYPGKIVQAFLHYAYTMKLPADLALMELVELLKLNDFLQTPDDFKLREIVLSKLNTVLRETKNSLALMELVELLNICALPQKQVEINLRDLVLSELCVAIEKPENFFNQKEETLQEDIDRLLKITSPYFDKGNHVYNETYAAKLVTFLLQADPDEKSEFWKSLKEECDLKPLSIISPLEKFVALSFTGTKPWELWSAPEDDLWVFKFDMDVWSLSKTSSPDHEIPSLSKTSSPDDTIPSLAKLSIKLDTVGYSYSPTFSLNLNIVRGDFQSSQGSSELRIRVAFLNDDRFDYGTSTAIETSLVKLNKSNWNPRDLSYNKSRYKELFIIISRELKPI